MDLPEEFPPSMVLAGVADHLKNHHSDLHVGLSTNQFTYQEALAATMDCVRDLPDRILLPTTNPARREALQTLALEDKRLLEEAIPFSSSRPICTTGKVEPEDCSKSLSPNMDLPEKYPASLILAKVADHLNDHHSDLRVALSTNHVTYQEALAATMDCVRGLPDRCYLRTTNPVRRAAFRKMALENKRLFDETTPLSSSRPIRITGKLESEHCPKSLSPNMDLSEKYPVSMILAEVADHIHKHHSELQVALPSNHFLYQEALSAIMESVRGLPDRILLPTNNLIRRAALRKMALENKEEATSSSSSRKIRTPGKLGPEDWPKPLSPDRRELLKKKYLD